MTDAVNKHLFKPIDEALVGLTSRTANGIRSLNVKYVGELAQLSASKVLCTRGFGRKSLNEIKKRLAAMDLSFEMRIDNWSTLLAAWTGSPVALTDEAITKMLKPIEDLKLAIRCEAALAPYFDYIGELAQATETDLLKTPDFAPRFLKEVRTKLAELDPEFVLGMKILDWNELLAERKVELLAEHDADREDADATYNRLAVLETENAVLRGKNELLERLLEKILDMEKKR